MRLTVLSRSATIPSTRRLVDEARRRGHRVRVLSPTKVEMHLDGRSANLYYQRKKLAPCDVVIPRIAQSISPYGLAVVNQYEMRGVALVNSANAIAQARNKMRSLQMLSANGIDIPATVMARDANVFSPFRTASRVGLGLGLFIAEQIMKAHHGTIGVIAEKGRATFRTIWPRHIT